jgi:hypothetical protein
MPAYHSAFSVHPKRSILLAGLFLCFIMTVLLIVFLFQPAHSEGSPSVRDIRGMVVGESLS